MITIHFRANTQAGTDAFEVQVPETTFAQLQDVARQHGWTLEGTIGLALDRFFDQHWPAGVPRPSKAPRT